MTTAIKRRRGTTTQHATFTGLEGELTVDTTKDTVVVHDGSTAGGFPLAKESQATSAVAITGGSINGTTVGATTAAAGKFTTLEATGVTTVQAGTVSAPAITTSGDTNTGIFFPAADTIAFTEGGVESMRIDSSGDVGIGAASPAAWTNPKLYVKQTGATPYRGLTVESSSNGNGIYVGHTGSVGTVGVSYGASGSFTPLTFETSGTERMRIDSSGNVGIGTSSPSQTLHVLGSALITSSAGGGVLQLGTSVANQYQQLNLGGANNGDNGWLVGKADTSTAIAPSLGFFIYDLKNSASRMVIDTSGNVGIGTSSPSVKLEVSGRVLGDSLVAGNAVYIWSQNRMSLGASYGIESQQNSPLFMLTQGVAQPIVFGTNGTERMRITSAGDVLVGLTSSSITAVGTTIYAHGELNCCTSGIAPIAINRKTSDGNLIRFFQDDVEEGNISVSGSTVSYNGGHLSRWSQLPDGSKDDTILKGTVMSNLDDMCVWEKDGVVAENEQLNKMKVSDVEGDTNFAGVFVNWTMDDAYGVDDMNVAMTGDMIIRIAQSVVVQKGDLLMSAGDGTAKPQGDDIVRSKTVAKVTSNYITCTYADGSYCVPCVLMAC